MTIALALPNAGVWRVAVLAQNVLAAHGLATFAFPRNPAAEALE